MQQVYSNFLNMLKSMLAILKKDKDYWENEPEIVSVVNEIETEYNEVVNILNNVAGLDQKGYTTAKNNAFDSIMGATYKLCRKMCAYARRNNDNVVLQLADHSTNSLAVGMKNDAISRCVAILNKAEAMLPNSTLGNFKVTLTEIEAIRQLMVVYNEHIDSRSTMKADKTTSIQDLSSQINSLRNRLILLDDLIEGLMEDEGMIARYKSSRTISNYGKSKTAKKKETETQASTEITTQQ